MAAVSSPRVAHALERFAGELRQRFGGRIAEIVVFGSQARGDAHEESDVDVLVVVVALRHAEKCEISDLAYETNAEDDDWVGLSPLACSVEEAAAYRGGGRRLWRDIAREGIPL
jgi:predicted nucleotidyltransferase